MQSPSIGRKVWYWCGEDQDENDNVCADLQAFDATVVFVNADGTVALNVVAHDGHTFYVDHITLTDPDEAVLEHNVTGEHATWMPYQKAQHEKANPVG